MTAHEFSKWLDKQPYEDKIVRIRFRHSFENEWYYSNELLLYGGDKCGDYEWVNDWDEGYEDVEILGCLPTSEVLIPTFREMEKLENDAASRLASIAAEIMFRR